MPTAHLYEKHERFPRPTYFAGEPSKEITQFAEDAMSAIRRCQESHGRCCINPIPGIVPQRLVYIGTETSHVCYLKDTNTTADQYATLSYCWGKGPHSHSLTKKNMKDFEKRITNIPPTLRDAILLVKCMGLNHIWIDALCIVQDDEEDWRTESRKMAGIYASALFCISALCTTGSDCRIFQNQVCSENSHYIPSSRRGSDFASSFESFPLNWRGWTLQERYLSPRLLHIGMWEAWFECRESLVSFTESNGLKSSKRIGATGTFIGLDRFSRILNDAHLGKLDSAESLILSLWYDMIMNYCPRQLSKATDRLIALDGLRCLYQQFINCNYIYGLWEKDIYNGLLWFNGINDHVKILSCVFDPPSMVLFKLDDQYGGSSSGMEFGREPVYHRRSRISSRTILRTLDKHQKLDISPTFSLDCIRDQSGNFPTWSWASISSPISFCYIQCEEYFILGDRKVPKLRIKVHRLTQLSLSQTQKPCLEVSGTIVKVKINQRFWISRIEYGIRQEQERSDVFGGRSSVFFDKGQPEKDVECHALVVYWSGPKKVDSGLLHLTLILLNDVQQENREDPPTEQRELVYERVGVAFIEYNDLEFSAYLNSELQQKLFIV